MNVYTRSEVARILAAIAIGQVGVVPAAALNADSDTRALAVHVHQQATQRVLAAAATAFDVEEIAPVVAAISRLAEIGG